MHETGNSNISILVTPDTLILDNHVVRNPVLVIFIGMYKSFASYLFCLIASWAAVEVQINRLATLICLRSMTAFGGRRRTAHDVRHATTHALRPRGFSRQLPRHKPWPAGARGGAPG